MHIDIEAVDEQSIEDGDTVNLTCSVNAQPYPHLAWKKNGKTYDGSSKQNRYGSRYVSDLVITKISREKGGNYTCWARNRITLNLLGVASKMLYVKCKYVFYSEIFLTVQLRPCDKHDW